MDEGLKRLEEFGLLKISKINSTGVKCRLSNNCIEGIANSMRGVYTDYQSFNEKRKKEIVLDGVKNMIQQIAFCDGNCPNCNFLACKVIFEIWRQMEKAGQVNLRTGAVVEHRTLLTFSVVEEKVKEAFKKIGYISPVIFTPDKIYEIPPFENKMEKEETYRALRELIQDENPEKYWVVLEVWYSHNVSISPSKDKNKEEKVMIVEFNRDDPAKERVVFYDFDFGNHALINREEHKGGGSNNRLNFYLEDVVEEKRREYFKEKLTEWIREHEKSVIEDAKKFFGSNDTEYVIKNMVEAALNDSIFPPGFIDKYKGKQDKDKSN